MKVKRFIAKLFGNKTLIKADAKSKFQYGGKLSVCYSADYDEDKNTITAFIEGVTATTSALANPDHELDIFELNSAYLADGLIKLCIKDPLIVEYDKGENYVIKADGTVVKYDTSKEAILDATPGDKIEINEDIVLESADLFKPVDPEQPEGDKVFVLEDVELDLNGHTLTISE